MENLNLIYLIIISINLSLLIVFFIGLFKIVRYTRESAENTSKLRQFVADIKSQLTGKNKKEIV